jgi:RimJ/RimL family protein N-acetyltransferase
MEFDILFRSFKKEDAVFVNKLRQSETVEEKIGGVKRFVSQEKDNKWIEDIIMDDGISKISVVICVNNPQQTVVGYTSISDIDYRNGTCFWSSLKILPEFAGKGYGYQATLKILKHAFEELRMTRCSAMGLESHEVALKMMEKAGYTKEGLMRNFVYKNGEHKNVWLLSVTLEDYKLIKEKTGL